MILEVSKFNVKLFYNNEREKDFGYLEEGVKLVEILMEGPWDE